MPLIIYGVGYILFAASVRGPIIANIIAVFVTELIIFHQTRNQEYTVVSVFSTVFNTVVCFFVMANLASMIVYMARLKHNLAMLVTEDVKLFDKMHEGIIVVEKGDLSLKFAS